MLVDNSGHSTTSMSRGYMSLREMSGDQPTRHSILSTVYELVETNQPSSRCLTGHRKVPTSAQGSWLLSKKICIPNPTALLKLKTGDDVPVPNVYE